MMAKKPWYFDTRGRAQTAVAFFLAALTIADAHAGEEAAPKLALWQEHVLETAQAIESCHRAAVLRQPPNAATLRTLQRLVSPRSELARGIVEFSDDPRMRLTNAAGMAVEGVWHLWRFTGHCKFSDFTPKGTLGDVPQILERYRTLVKEYNGRTREELVGASIPRNIELLKTVYCGPAYITLQGQIFLKPKLLASGTSWFFVTPPQSRREVHAAMKAMYDRNKEQIEWDVNFGKFVVIRDRWPHQVDLKLDLRRVFPPAALLDEHGNRRGDF